MIDKINLIVVGQLTHKMLVLRESSAKSSSSTLEMKKLADGVLAKTSGLLIP